jgi:hypothetical protein
MMSPSGSENEDEVVDVASSARRARRMSSCPEQATKIGTDRVLYEANESVTA